MRGILRYTLVWGARYTLRAHYLSKNTVYFLCFFNVLSFVVDTYLSQK